MILIFLNGQSAFKSAASPPSLDAGLVGQARVHRLSLELEEETLTLEELVCTELVEEDPLVLTCRWEQRTVVRIEFSTTSCSVVQPGALPPSVVVDDSFPVSAFSIWV
jgi:hypothetical protein